MSDDDKFVLWLTAILFIGAPLALFGGVALLALAGVGVS